MIKISTLLEVIKSIENAKFDFHPIKGINSSLSCYDFHWQISIAQSFNSDENYTYAEIVFNLRILGILFNLDSKEIALNSIDEYIECAKKEFIEQISEIQIKEFSNLCSRKIV